MLKSIADIYYMLIDDGLANMTQHPDLPGALTYRLAITLCEEWWNAVYVKSNHNQLIEDMKRATILASAEKSLKSAVIYSKEFTTDRSEDCSSASMLDVEMDPDDN